MRYAGAELQPEINPIELVLSKLKVFLKNVAAHPKDELPDAIAVAIDLFRTTEFIEDFAAAGYDRTRSENAVVPYRGL